MSILSICIQSAVVALLAVGMVRQIFSLFDIPVDLPNFLQEAYWEGVRRHLYSLKHLLYSGLTTLFVTALCFGFHLWVLSVAIPVLWVAQLIWAHRLVKVYSAITAV